MLNNTIPNARLPINAEDIEEQLRKLEKKIEAPYIPDMANATHKEAIPLLIIGIGGGGIKIVDRMFQDQCLDASFVSMGTDNSHLDSANADYKMPLGPVTNRGRGSNGSVDIGKSSAEESRKQIQEYLSDAPRIFLVSCFGGGTGTGATPTVASIAKEAGATVTAFVATPFRFEGPRRNRTAEEGIARLLPHVDNLFSLSNDELLKEIEQGNDMAQALSLADNVVYQCIKDVYGEEAKGRDNLTNLSFAPVKPGAFAGNGKHFAGRLM
jgi:cell division protein FtsZ